MNADIVEDIVRWRMGTAYDAPILDWRDRRLNFDSVALLDSAIAGGVTAGNSGFQVHSPPDRGEYNPSQHSRLVDAAEDMFKARTSNAMQLSAFVVMNDARLFPSTEYFGPPTAAICTQISYARPAGTEWRSRTELMLWPLSAYFRPWRLPTLTPVPWHLRRLGLLWRG